MKVGDLVKARMVTHVTRPKRIGIITSAEDRHKTGVFYFFVRFSDKGDGFWFHPSKLEVISESR